MIQSMTGFGRSTFEVSSLEFELEVRTVNHRHLDIRVKLPRLLGHAESEVKAAVQSRFSRGKVDVNVHPAGDRSASSAVVIDHVVAREYLQAAAEFRSEFGIAGDLDIKALLSLPGVTRFADPDISVDHLSEALTVATAEALDAVATMREREGDSLRRDVEARLEKIVELVSDFETRSGEVIEAAKERLRKRSQQLEEETGLLDQARLHQEIVIAADRMDINEETVRLRSHVDQFRGILGEAGPGKPIGRRLDFLLQELGREANTVGSKAADAELSHRVVELKTEIERIREQVQNIE